MGSEIKLIFNAVMVGSQARWVSARLSFFFSVPVSLFWFTSMQFKSYALQKTFFLFLYDFVFGHNIDKRLYGFLFNL